MVSKSATINSVSPKMDPQSVLQLGKVQTEAMLHMQKEALDAYENAGRAWLARVKSEVELWSDLGARLTAISSMPDGVEAYRDCLSKRIKMAADDGRRLFEDGQKIIGALTRGLANGWAKEL